MTERKYDKELDVRDRKELYPSLRAIEILDEMEAGQVLKVIVNSERSIKFIKRQLKQKDTGKWLGVEEADDGYEWSIYLERIYPPIGLGNWVKSMVDDMIKREKKWKKK